MVFSVFPVSEGFDASPTGLVPLYNHVVLYCEQNGAYYTALGRTMRTSWADSRERSILIICSAPIVIVPMLAVIAGNATMRKPVITVFLVLISAVSGLLGVIAGFLGLFGSLFAFDAPGSDKNLLNWLVVACVLSPFPICIVSIVGSWIAYARNRYGLAVLIALTPLIILLAVAAIAFVVFH